MIKNEEYTKMKPIESLENHIIDLYARFTSQGQGGPGNPIINHDEQNKIIPHQIYVALKAVFGRKKPASPRFLMELSDIMTLVAKNEGHKTLRENSDTLSRFRKRYGVFLLRNKETIKKLQDTELQNYYKDDAGQPDPTERRYLSQRLLDGMAAFDESDRAKKKLIKFSLSQHPFWYDQSNLSSPVSRGVIESSLALHTGKPIKFTDETGGISFAIDQKKCVVTQFKESGAFVQHVYRQADRGRLSMQLNYNS